LRRPLSSSSSYRNQTKFSFLVSNYHSVTCSLAREYRDVHIDFEDPSRLWSPSHGLYFLDLRTRVHLLKRENNGDVYELPRVVEKVKIALVTTLTSAASWQARLSHPSHQSLTTLIRSYSLPVLSSLALSSCDACLSNKSHKLPFFSLLSF
ncbi:unnamed protein product, partial [Linum tenue]